MLASTIQFSHNTPPPPTTTHTQCTIIDNHDLMKKQHFHVISDTQQHATYLLTLLM